MIRALLLLILCGPLMAGTRILDTIYTPFAFVWSGKLSIVCPSATDGDGQTIAAWKKIVTVTNGAFDQTIDAGDAGTSLGRTCAVAYAPNSGSGWTETWYVTTSVAPLTIAQVRTSAPGASVTSITPSQITLANGALIYGASGHGSPLTAPADGACYGLAYVDGVPSFTACASGDNPWTRTGTTISPTNAGDTVTIGSTVLDGSAFQTNGSALSTPADPGVTVHGSAGSATYGYQILALTYAGPSVPSQEVDISNGPTTLNGANYVIVTPPACAGAVVGYAVWRVNADFGTYDYGPVGTTTCGVPLNDQGQAVSTTFGYGVNQGPPSQDHSIGAGTTLPIVSTSSFSAFGSMAYANVDAEFPWNDTGTGLVVVEHTGNSNFDYNPFLSFLIVDADTGKGYAAGIFDIDFRVPFNNVGATHNGVETSMVTHANVTAGSFGNYMGFLLLNSGNTVTAPMIHSFGASPQIRGTVSSKLAGFFDTVVIIGGTVPRNYGAYISTPSLSSGGVVTTLNAAYANENMTGIAGAGKDFSAYSLGGTAHFETGEAATVGVEIVAHSSQTADLLRLLSSDGTTVLTSIPAAGITKASSGTRYVCINSSGVLASSTSACSGT